MSNMTLSEELQWRGFVNQTTLSSLKKLDTAKLKFYHGFDASADSLTVGNLAGVMLDKTLARHGHHPVVVFGGGTSLIGDPGGKDSERPLQSEAAIATNIQAIGHQLKTLIGTRATFVNNADWLKKLSMVHFLRDVGKHFSITPLIQRDYIARRIGEGGEGISYTEFSYTLLQGYDFLHLHQYYDVDMQVAGADQWGNCLSGVDLIRKVTGDETHVLTMPLIINKATGKKFGKSEDGAVWLDADKTSVYKFYQFWLNVDDEGVGDYLKIFTELSKDKITDVMAKFHGERGARVAQKTLAYEVTRLVHGEKRADSVRRITEALFGEHQFADLHRREVDVLRDELPYIQFKGEKGLAAVIVDVGLAKSNSEALRFIASGAISVNGNKIDPSEEYPFHRGSNLLKRGKNNFAIVEHK